MAKLLKANLCLCIHLLDTGGCFTAAVWQDKGEVCGFALCLTLFRGKHSLNELQDRPCTNEGEMAVNDQFAC